MSKGVNGFLELLKEFVPVIFLTAIGLALLLVMAYGETFVVIPEEITKADIVQMVQGLQIYFWALGGLLLFVGLGFLIIGKNEERDDTTTVLAPIEETK